MILKKLGGGRGGGAAMVGPMAETYCCFLCGRQGISICRSKEDLEEMCQIKVLATAKIEAARKLGWSSSRAMEI